MISRGGGFYFIGYKNMIVPIYSGSRLQIYVGGADATTGGAEVRLRCHRRPRQSTHAGHGSQRRQRYRLSRGSGDIFDATGVGRKSWSAYESE